MISLAFVTSNKRLLLFIVLNLFISLGSMSKPSIDTLTVLVTCPKLDYDGDYPVIVSLKDYPSVTKSIVYSDNTELPSQLDDLDGDGINDELCFFVNVKKKQKYSFQVILEKDGEPKRYSPHTYAELLLKNPKIKEKNKQDLFIQQIVVGKDLDDSFHLLHHHGVAFENELIALRVYFDKRQTLDLYGKKRKGLEIKDTQFYPNKQQLLDGYGDDILWAGNALGLGALRGWVEFKEQLLDDVEYRGQRIVCQGPIRTIVEVTDKGWLWKKGENRISLKQRFTLYAGRRDIILEAWLNPSNDSIRFFTGLQHLLNGKEYSDHEGLRGNWGKSCNPTDSIMAHAQTLGMGIFVPDEYLCQEMPCDSLNDAFILAPQNGYLRYYLTYSSDKESYGFHQAQIWFSYLRRWKELLAHPIRVDVICKNP